MISRMAAPMIMNREDAMETMACETNNFIESTSAVRLVSSFEEFNYAQTRTTVVEGHSIIPDAVNEILKFELQSLRLFHSGSPYIPGTVTHQQVIDALAVGHLHSFVIDLDFFVGLEVVPHQHLFLPADQSRSDFDGGKPIDVNMRDHVTGKIDGNESHVRQTIQMPPTCSNDRLWFLLDDVIHNGQIMGSKVPHDVYIMLEEAKVHPG